MRSHTISPAKAPKGVRAASVDSLNGLDGFANVIILGQLLKQTGIFEYQQFLDLMVAGIPAAKAALIEKNKKALEIGYNYEA